MKTIPLTQGYEALVDDEDYEFLMRWKWYAYVRADTDNVYAVRSSEPDENGKQRTIRMHRVINKTPEGMHTDHVDGNALNNRKSNLRAATSTQNQWNSRPSRNGTSRHKGVHWDTQHRKWLAQISVGGKKLFLGRYRDESAAAAAYADRAKQEFGEFHREAQQ